MRAFLLALAASCAAFPLAAQSPGPAPAQAGPKATFVKTEAEAVVTRLASLLEENFVFPDKGKAYAQMLRSRLAAGTYSSFADGQAFAQQVTADLQAVHKDGHLRVHAPRNAVAPKQQVRRGPPPNFNAISKSGWLADGVAYIRFEAFPGNEPTLASLNQFLAAHKDAKTLIIDARSHRGGGLAEMAVMFPHLFGKATTLVAMDTRAAVEEPESSPLELAVMRKVPGPEGVVRHEHYVTPAAQPTGLRDAKLFLLTSEGTISAGEHLSLVLKRTKRATLVGETTRGAGHYGGVEDLGHGYAAFIPVGRTFDPDTNEGWEGVGVKPDVAVPADKALDEALKLAGVDVSGDVALAALKS